MGKSDPYLLNFYTSMLENNKEYNRVGFFGQSGENFISKSIRSKNRKFYDLSLGNWDINKFPYKVDAKFDLIVCTRCAYFCKNPEEMLINFSKMLTVDGKILVDWGLGDHWRFKNYKIGWVKDGEQEWAYKENNFLWSTIWHKSFEKHPAYIKFENEVKKLGYCNVKESIIQEVPEILLLEKIKFKNCKYNIMTLWSDNPQIYFCILVEI